MGLKILLSHGLTTRKMQQRVETPPLPPPASLPQISISSHKLGICSSFAETPMAAYWSTLPDTLSAGRVYSENVKDRLGALKTLIMISNPRVFGVDANIAPKSKASRDMFNIEFEKEGVYSDVAKHAYHPMWEVMSDCDWMWRSGRLHVNTASTTTHTYGVKVDESLWWSKLHFLLTVVPLMGYLESDARNHHGARERLTCVSVIGESAKAELRRPGVRRLIRLWGKAWEQRYTGLAERVWEGQPIHPALQESIRMPYWNARAMTAELALSLYASELSALPTAEQELAKGFCLRTRVLAPSYPDSSLMWVMSHGGGCLPDYILVDKQDILTQRSKQNMNIFSSIGSHVDGSVGSSIEDVRAVTIAEKEAAETSTLRQLGRVSPRKAAILIHTVQAASGSTFARRHTSALLRPWARGKPPRATWMRLLSWCLVPPLNYRLFEFPLGIDPVEEHTLDPNWRGYGVWGRPEFAAVGTNKTHYFHQDVVDWKNITDIPVDIENVAPDVLLAEGAWLEKSENYGMEDKWWNAENEYLGRIDPEQEEEDNERYEEFMDKFGQKGRGERKSNDTMVEVFA